MNDHDALALGRMYARREARYGHLRNATREELVDFIVHELEKADEFTPFMDRIDRAVNVCESRRQIGPQKRSDFLIVAD